MDKKFGQSILDKIKEKKLAPKARWRFLLKDYMIWGLGLSSLLVGSMSVAVILYMFTYNDWGVHTEFNQSFLSYIIISLPYFWLIFLGLFLAVIYYNFKHTKHGYRHSLSMVLGGSILASVVMGVFFFGIGMGEAIDDILGRQVPYYEKIINRNLNMWQNPESGRLAGMVIGKKDDKILIIFSLDKQEWQVDVSAARIMCQEEPSIGNPIKAIGKTVGEFKFEASQIMSVGPGREFFKRGHFHQLTP